MIVCSCNFLSESQVRSVIGCMPRLRMSQVYRSLGCTAECGRCGHTIKIILEEVTRFVTTEALAIGPTEVHCCLDVAEISKRYMPI
jgi:bacterioferritin-associated ferredoxin